MSDTEELGIKMTDKTTVDISVVNKIFVAIFAAIIAAIPAIGLFYQQSVRIDILESELKTIRNLDIKSRMDVMENNMEQLKDDVREIKDQGKDGSRILGEIRGILQSSFEKGKQ